jgi:hypothetical protein
MTYILGGSRHIVNLPSEVKVLLDEKVSTNEFFNIGDAPGSDTSFQSFFANKQYKNIKIFSSAGYIRNNVGNWDWELIDSGLKSKSNSVHAFKDRYMCKISNSGIMIWDCQSAGTLSNVIDLVESGKSCRIWVALDAELYNFDNLPSLEKWLKQYPDVTKEAYKRLNTFRRREAKRTKSGPPALFD